MEVAEAGYFTQVSSQVQTLLKCRLLDFYDNTWLALILPINFSFFIFKSELRTKI